MKLRQNTVSRCHTLGGARVTLSTRISAVLISSIISGAVLSGLSGAAHATEPNEGDSKNLTVEVVGPTVPIPTPHPSESTTAPDGEGMPSTPDGSGAIAGNGPLAPVKLMPASPDMSGSAPSLSQETITNPSDADQALGDNAVDSGGLLYVSGVKPTSSHSLHPSGGTVTVEVSVRNISTQTIDGAVEFWISTLWGWRMSEPLNSDVVGLAPGETRTLTATLSGPGQWALYETHATFTPPETIDGTETPPIQREHFLFVPPYFALALVAALVLLYTAYRYWRRRAIGRETIAK